MREQEVLTDNFLPTKKEIQTTTKNFAKNIIESGDFNKQEIYSQVIRLKETFNTLESEIKNSLTQESFEAFGLKGVFSNGGDKLQYTDDKTYSDILKDLKDREELLKTAYKSKKPIYDDEGVEVPKVSSKPIKSSLKISY